MKFSALIWASPLSLSFVMSHGEQNIHFESESGSMLQTRTPAASTKVDVSALQDMLSQHIESQGMFTNANQATALASMFQKIAEGVTSAETPTKSVNNDILDLVATLVHDSKESLKNDRNTHQQLVKEAQDKLSEGCKAAEEAACNSAYALTSMDDARKAHEECREGTKDGTGQIGLLTQKAGSCGIFQATVEGNMELHSAAWWVKSGKAIYDAALTCDTHAKAFDSKDEECDEKQQIYQNLACTYYSRIKDTCATFDECLTHEEQNLVDEMKKVRELVANNKNVWVAFHKAECYVNYLKSYGSEMGKDADRHSDEAKSALTTCQTECDEYACVGEELDVDFPRETDILTWGQQQCDKKAQDKANTQWWTEGVYSDSNLKGFMTTVDSHDGSCGVLSASDKQTCNNGFDTTHGDSADKLKCPMLTPQVSPTAVCAGTSCTTYDENTCCVSSLDAYGDNLSEDNR